jgi:hypothetical protein
MAESKFLKWQDMDSDGLIDVCDDLIMEKPLPCPSKCIPNPVAITPNWKKEPSLAPWINKKTCYYEIVKETHYTTTVPEELLEGDEVDEGKVREALNARALEFVPEVIETLLMETNKADSVTNINAVSADLQFHKYDLGVRKANRLKLLFRVPFDTIDPLEEAEDDGPIPEDEKPGWVSVEYSAADLSTKLITVRRGLNMMGRYVKVYRAIDGGNVKFLEDDRLFNLENYGDPCLFTPNGSILAKMQNELESFMNDRNLQIPGIGNNSSFGATLASPFASITKDNITRIKFESKDYKLKQIVFWTDGCGEKAFYLNKKLAPLLRSENWSDITAVGYISQLYKMDAALTARKPPEWQDFIIEYTYPKIYATTNPGDISPWNKTSSCIQDALDNELKELGQDIFDEVLNIGDVIAYQFRNGLCRYNMEELRDMEMDYGIADTINPGSKKKHSMMAMAKMQAFKELAESDQVFAALCARILGDSLGWKNVTQQMDDMYEYGLERIKVCGLFDLGLDAIKCLLGGLTLEQALSSMLKAALAAMNIENFGDLFIGLPAGKQAELDALVKKNFEKGNLFRPDSEMQQYSDALAAPGTEYKGDGESIEDTPLTSLGSGTLGTGMKLTKPWEDPVVVSEDHNKRSNMDQWSDSSSARRSLSDQIASGRASDDNLDPTLVMDLYIQGLLEVYQDNYLELLDELNKFPGAELISALIALFDCPMPPLFNPSIADFMKSFGLPFCRDMREIRIPRMWDPSEWYPDFCDFMKWLWDQFKIAVKQAVFNILILILVKICQILGDAICKALETVGNIAAAMPALLAGNQQIRNIIRDSICGPDATDEMIDNTMIDLFAKLGPGAAALANQESVIKFVEDLSSSTTRRELAEAFEGRPSQEFLEVSRQLIEYEYPEFKAGLGNPDQLTSLFRNTGAMMPAQARQDLKDFLNELPDDDFFPANPTLCLSPKKQEDFAALRCELLAGQHRTSTGQCEDSFRDLIDEMKGNVTDLTAMMSGAPGGPGGDGAFEDFVMQNMPKLFSEPGCDDGLLPDMPEATKTVASSALGNDFEMLKIDYSKDMLGNGGLFATNSDWGFMNMILSDTKGNPLTAHHRLGHNRNNYVDFASNLINGGEASTGFFAFMQGNSKFNDQRGQFPSYVGEWLMRQLLCAGGVTDDLDEADMFDNGETYNLFPIQSPGGWAKDLKNGESDVIDGRTSFSYNAGNTWDPGGAWSVTWEDLDFNQGWGVNVDLMQIPDFGYNTPISVDWDGEKIVIEEKGRKKYPDMILNYQDNAAGLREGCNRGRNKNSSSGDEGSFSFSSGEDMDSSWSYGFEILYFSGDMVDDSSFDSSGEESEPVELPGPEGEYDLTKDMSPEEKAEYEAAVRSSNPDAITNVQDGVKRNRADDNVRIKIVEKMNTSANVESPLSEMMAEDMDKSDGFDLPTWIEQVPIVGWVLQAVVNIFTKPFSSLIRPASAIGAPNDDGETIVLNERYEFLAVDNGLDGIDLSQYPEFLKCFTSHTAHSPQVVMLSELAGIDKESALTSVNSFMDKFFKDWAKEIGTNQNGWLYGAKFDYLLPSDTDYVASYGSKYDTSYPTPRMYDTISITETDTDGDTSTRPVRNRDMIMGQSRDQYMNEVNGTPESTRVYYLNPGNYGGSYVNPPIHIKPLQFGGWMGLVQVMFPELSPCKPQRTDLVNFGEIQQKIDSRISKIPEDPRLKQGPDCALEVPYNRILDRAGKTGLMGVIEAAIRIFASTHFLKGMPTFSRIQPKFPENFSNIYSQYIVEIMEERFKEAQHPFWEMFNLFSDQEFWYAFLEQSVQFYAWRLDNGEIENPSASVLNALRRLNDYQERYDFPYGEDLIDAKQMKDAHWLQTLKGYRFDKNLEGVVETEEDAKLVLAELVAEQLTIMGDRLVSNLRAQGYIPTVYDLDYWIFQHQCAGSEIKIAGPKFIEEPVGLPTPDNPDPAGAGDEWPGPYYTAGGEFRVAADGDLDNGFELGDEYIGFYFGYEESTEDGALQGDIVYVVGDPAGGFPFPIEGESITDVADVIRPLATKIKVVSEQVKKQTYSEDLPAHKAQHSKDGDRDKTGLVTTLIDLGDVPEYGTASTSGDYPFALEKFISIEGTKMSSSSALSVIMGSNDNALLMSEAYPGPAGNRLRQVRNSAGIVVGVEGEMGVRYGLQFYFLHAGSKIPIADVSVNALDLPIAATPPFDGSSKLLLCLLNMMKSHPQYRLMTSYIFPMKKITSTLAVYNDMGFLSAIGEVTVGRGDWDRYVPMGDGVFSFNGPKSDTEGDWINSDIKGVRSKPGSIAFISEDESEIEVEDPYWGDGGILRPDGDEPYWLKIKTLNQGKSFVGGNEGWVHHKNRQPGWFGGIGIMEWDSWDRVLLRNSVARIKRMFKGYYNSRDWQPGDIDKFPAGAVFIKNLKNRMMPNPAMGIVPWWKRNRVRSTPFNDKGALCDK